MIPENTFLGKLKIIKIYEYGQDELGLFLVSNSINYFLCFLFDYEENSVGYLYIEIDENTINKLENKILSYHDVYINSNKYYLVYLGHSEIAGIDTIYIKDTVPNDYFPPQGFFVEYIDNVDNYND